MNRFKCMNGFANRPMIASSWRIASRTGDKNGYIQEINYLAKCEKKLEMGVLIAIANDLDDPIFTLWEKGLQAVVNDNEAENDETGLEIEGKGNGRKSPLFNLKDTAILYNLLNLLWLLQMMPLETSTELNIESSQLKISFFRQL